VNTGCIPEKSIQKPKNAGTWEPLRTGKLQKNTNGKCNISKDTKKQAT
jgi:hypothetical protein